MIISIFILTILNFVFTEVEKNLTQDPRIEEHIERIREMEVALTLPITSRGNNLLAIVSLFPLLRSFLTIFMVA